MSTFMSTCMSIHMATHTATQPTNLVFSAHNVVCSPRFFRRPPRLDSTMFALVHCLTNASSILGIPKFVRRRRPSTAPKSI